MVPVPAWPSKHPDEGDRKKSATSSVRMLAGVVVPFHRRFFRLLFMFLSLFVLGVASDDGWPIFSPSSNAHTNLYISFSI